VQRFCEVGCATPEAPPGLPNGRVQLIQSYWAPASGTTPVRRTTGARTGAQLPVTALPTPVRSLNRSTQLTGTSRTRLMLNFASMKFA
jgi:hypothetical protein